MALGIPSLQQLIDQLQKPAAVAPKLPPASSSPQGAEQIFIISFGIVCNKQTYCETYEVVQSEMHNIKILNKSLAAFAAGWMKRGLCQDSSVKLGVE